MVSGIEVTEPRVISKAPPEELVISPDFIEAKDFVQTVKVLSICLMMMTIQCVDPRDMREGRQAVALTSMFVIQFALW